jgi:hypothetical protein
MLSPNPAARAMCVPEMQNMLISTNQHPRHSGLNQFKPRPCEMGGRQVGRSLLEKEWKAFARFRFFFGGVVSVPGPGCMSRCRTRTFKSPTWTLAYQPNECQDTGAHSWPSREPSRTDTGRDVPLCILVTTACPVSRRNGSDSDPSIALRVVLVVSRCTPKTKQATNRAIRAANRSQDTNDSREDHLDER